MARHFAATWCMMSSEEQAKVSEYVLKAFDSDRGPQTLDSLLPCVPSSLGWTDLSSSYATLPLADPSLRSLWIRPPARDAWEFYQYLAWKNWFWMQEELEQPEGYRLSPEQCQDTWMESKDKNFILIQKAVVEKNPSGAEGKLTISDDPHFAYPQTTRSWGACRHRKAQ